MVADFSKEVLLHPLGHPEGEKTHFFPGFGSYMVETYPTLQKENGFVERAKNHP